MCESLEGNEEMRMQSSIYSLLYAMMVSEKSSTLVDCTSTRLGLDKWLSDESVIMQIQCKHLEVTVAVPINICRTEMCEKWIMRNFLKIIKCLLSKWALTFSHYGEFHS